MSRYSTYQEIYNRYPLWEDFLQQVSSGHYKQLLLLSIEEGWSFKVACDIRNIYLQPNAIVDAFMIRIHQMMYMTPTLPSIQELALQLNATISAIDFLRAYLRYAYFTAGDGLEDIFFRLDESLSELGTCSPSSLQCRLAYKALTGRETTNTLPIKQILEQLSAEIKLLKEKANPDLELTINRLQNLHNKLVTR